MVNRCVLLNARSLRNKLCDFNSLLLDKPNYLTVSVTESWLNSSVTNPMIDTSGRYVVHRNDRLTKQGGGVLCLVTNKDWPSHTISLPEKFSSLDIVAVTVCTDVGPIRYYITAYTAHPSSTNLGAKIWFCY